MILTTTGERSGGVRETIDENQVSERFSRLPPEIASKVALQSQRAQIYGSIYRDYRVRLSRSIASCVHDVEKRPQPNALGAFRRVFSKSYTVSRDWRENFVYQERAEAHSRAKSEQVL